MPKNKESKNIKGVEHIQYVDNIDLLSYSFVGAALGGMPRCCAPKEDFNLVRAGSGAVILTISTLLGTNAEAIIGFLLYNIEGAVIGLIAGTSMEASVGALAGVSIGIAVEIRELVNNGPNQDFRSNALGKIFYKTIGGAFAGFFINEMRQNQQHFASYNDKAGSSSVLSLMEVPKVFNDQANDIYDNAALWPAEGGESSVDSSIKPAIKHEHDDLSKNITLFNEIEFTGNVTYENNQNEN